MKDRICVVVVTYNRIQLLQECVLALREQTKKLDGIIVVNNNSIDGTKEWLENQLDLISIHQPNLGGAGGFHNGMKMAHELGYDWIWFMDDDCLPDKYALKNLFQNDLQPYYVYNSLVLSKSNSDIINFGLYDSIERKYFLKFSQLEKKEFVNGGSFFNGSLFSKQVIDMLGLPIADFFIYGDDYEYYLRIQSRKIQIITYKSSIVLHPEQKFKCIGSGKLFYRWSYFNSNSTKYFPRNVITIWFYYAQYSTLRLLKTLMYDLTGIIIIQRRVDFFLKYIISIIQAPFFIYKIRTQLKR